MIYVFSYWEMERWVRPSRPQWLISILGPADHLPWPEFHTHEHHLRLCFDDTEHRLGGKSPSKKDIQDLLVFLRQWNCDGSLLIHCNGGISRSPAAALIALVLFNPGKERAAADMLRSQGAHADPNIPLIKLADVELRLDGKLMEAVDNMTEPTGWGAYRSIELPTQLNID